MISRHFAENSHQIPFFKLFIYRCNRLFSHDAKKIPVSSPLTITKAKQTVTEKQKIELIQKKHQISTEVK